PVLNRVVIGNRSQTQCDRRPLTRPKSDVATDFLSPVGLSEGWRYSPDRIAIRRRQQAADVTHRHVVHPPIRNRISYGPRRIPEAMVNAFLWRRSPPSSAAHQSRDVRRRAW